MEQTVRTRRTASLVLAFALLTGVILGWVLWVLRGETVRARED